MKYFHELQSRNPNSKGVFVLGSEVEIAEELEDHTGLFTCLTLKSGNTVCVAESARDALAKLGDN